MTTTDSNPIASMCRQKPAIQSGSAHTPERTGGSAATLIVVTSLDLLAAPMCAWSTLGHGVVIAPVETELALGEAPRAGLAHEVVLVAHGHDEQAPLVVTLVDVMGETHRLAAGAVPVDIEHLTAHDVRRPEVPLQARHQRGG